MSVQRAVPVPEMVVAWHKARFPTAEPWMVALKASEEVGELASAVLGQFGRESATGDGDVVAEAADVAIALIVLLGRWYGADLLAAVEEKMKVLTAPHGGHRAALLEQR